jgi:hypothetical protein
VALQGEARYTLDAGIARHAVGGGDFLEAGVACQHGRDVVALQPALDAEPRQDLGAADVGAVTEIALEQRLDDAVLYAALAGQPDQAMGIERVGRAGQLVEMELQADGAGGLGDALVELARALGAAELGQAILGAIDALARHIRIELEGMPGHREVQALLVEEGQRAFEVALADVAPWADHVGDDVDAADRLCLVHGCFLP